MSAAPVRQGDIVAGKYRVERVLGMGAMGVVVAATHVDLHEMRALKIMLASRLGDVAGVERFLREARATVKLKSEHVALVHDIGRLESGAPYMVMEYLDGKDLKEVLDTVGKLDVGDAAFLLCQACAGIGAAHAMGIVHRDLKPANLFVTRPSSGGSPLLKIVDFGIAKVVTAPGDMEITNAADMLGTPLYMSPEQMRGANDVDGRTDIWALGAIFFRMLTGRTPFEGTSITEICSAVVADDPPRPRALDPNIPAALEAVILRCLEKRPEKRFATAAELRAAVLPFAKAPVLGATPLSGASPTVATEAASGAAATINNTAQSASWVHPQTPSLPKRSSAPWLLAAALGVAALGGGTAYFLSRAKPRSSHAAASTAPKAEAGPVDAVATVASVTMPALPVPSAQLTPSAPASTPVASAPSPSASHSAPAPKATGVVLRPPPPPPPPPAIPPPVYVPPPDAFGTSRR